MEIYVVKRGDTYDSIANQFGVNVTRMLRDNWLNRSQPLVVGETIVIRYPEEVYIVQEGDTLFSIAEKYQVSIEELRRNNIWMSPYYRLRAGQEVIISYQTERLRDIVVTGYVYSFIDEETLVRELPFLTGLNVFSYDFTDMGDLIPIEDEEIVHRSLEQRTVPIMAITTIRDESSFSGEKAQQLFESEEKQENFITQILETMAAKGYEGVDVDFEFVYPEDRDAYTAFLQKLRDSLKPHGYEMSVAVPPKISSTQQGSLYEAYDYYAIGEIADSVLLMTYEWGYSGGPARAVAPIDEVRKVLDYAVTEIPKEKILLGIPNYGYDWTLPYIPDGQRAKVISNTEAVRIAGDYRTEILYDEKYQSPYFRYTDSFGKKHEVWFEDARSIEAKLRLVDEYGLKGVGYWNLMRLFPQNELVLDSLYDIIKTID
jgi:spore germination protein